MIQSTLTFLFGFVVATFLALLIAPTVWRRAVYLTRKRIEAAVPLTANELRAEKDKLRAEHAIQVRKLEAQIEAVSDQFARSKSDVGRLSESGKELISEIKRLTGDILSLNRTLGERDVVISGLETNANAQGLQIETLRADVLTRNGQVENLQRVSDEVRRKLSQAEELVAARDKEYEFNREEIAQLKTKRRDEQIASREVVKKVSEIDQLLISERKKTEGLEKQIEKAVRSQTDLEEKLARKEREISRISEEKAKTTSEADVKEDRIAELEEERDELDRDLREMTLAHNRLEKELQAVSTGSLETAHLEAKIGKLEADNARLERERNDAVSAVVGAPGLAGLGKPFEIANSETADEALRDKVNQLAAEMANLTAILEGEGNRVDALITDSQPSSGNVISLADRIRVLREKALKAAE